MLLSSIQGTWGRLVARRSGMPKARGLEPAIMIPNVGEDGGTLKDPGVEFLLWRIWNIVPWFEMNQARAKVKGALVSPTAVPLIRDFSVMSLCWSSPGEPESLLRRQPPSLVTQKHASKGINSSITNIYC